MLTGQLNMASLSAGDFRNFAPRFGKEHLEKVTKRIHFFSCNLHQSSVRCHSAKLSLLSKASIWLDVYSLLDEIAVLGAVKQFALLIKAFEAVATAKTGPSGPYITEPVLQS